MQPLTTAIVFQTVAVAIHHNRHYFSCTQTYRDNYAQWVTLDYKLCVYVSCDQLLISGDYHMTNMSASHEHHMTLGHTYLGCLAVHLVDALITDAYSDQVVLGGTYKASSRQLL